MPPPPPPRELIPSPCTTPPPPRRGLRRQRHQVQPLRHAHLRHLHPLDGARIPTSGPAQAAASALPLTAPDCRVGTPTLSRLKPGEDDPSDLPFQARPRHPPHLARPRRHPLRMNLGFDLGMPPLRIIDFPLRPLRARHTLLDALTTSAAAGSGPARTLPQELSATFSAPTSAGGTISTAHPIRAILDQRTDTHTLFHLHSTPPVTSPTDPSGLRQTSPPPLQFTPTPSGPASSHRSWRSFHYSFFLRLSRLFFDFHSVVV